MRGPGPGYDGVARGARMARARRSTASIAAGDRLAVDDIGAGGPLADPREPCRPSRPTAGPGSTTSRSSCSGHGREAPVPADRRRRGGASTRRCSPPGSRRSTSSRSPTTAAGPRRPMRSSRPSGRGSRSPRPGPTTRTATRPGRRSTGSRRPARGSIGPTSMARSRSRSSRTARSCAARPAWGGAPAGASRRDRAVIGPRRPTGLPVRDPGLRDAGGGPGPGPGARGHGARRRRPVARSGPTRRRRPSGRRPPVPSRTMAHPDPLRQRSPGCGRRAERR